MILDGGNAGETIVLHATRAVLGRGADVDINIRDPAISRQHCAITRTAGGWEVSDLGTTNGTRVNGRKIDRSALADGDEVGLGGALLLFVDPEEPSFALTIEGQTRLADAVATPRWRSRQLDELLQLGEQLAWAKDDRAMLEVMADWLESTLFISSTTVRRRMGSRWTKVFERGTLRTDPGDEAEIRRSAAHGDVRWLDSSRLVCTPLFGASPPHVLAASVADGDPPPSEWELRLTACAARLVGSSLGGARSRGPTGDVPNLARTKSDAMKAAVELLDRVAGSDATVQVRGESGTGKELAARWLHEHGARALQPFVAVNCGALPETLLESELFGHEAGAFTGAHSRHAGRFERAHRGTLFLDEIGELSQAAQTRLLRVLETRTIERVGGVEPISVDVRIVAATHRDLRAMCASGEFREDLFYRLAVLSVDMPPLRERREDIRQLANQFLAEGREDQGRSLEGFEEDTVRVLEAYRWPGNVRELRNAVAHACIIAMGPLVTPADLPPHVVTAPPGTTTGAAGKSPAVTQLALPASLRDVEEAAVRAALAAADGNKSQAARFLGINRATLYAKIELYSIE